MTAGLGVEGELSAGRAVVCDDDALVRSVVAQVLTDHAVEVVGEAETPDEALDLVARYDADIVIVDLALRGGSGEELMRAIRAGGHETRIVVYSAFAAEREHLLRSGASAVVDKPDFGALGAAVAEVAAGRVERRRIEARTVTPLPSPPALSISGLEPWESFVTVADMLEPGDAILVLDVLPTPSLQAAWDGVLELDHRIALGRALAGTRRAQDRVSITPGGRPVALLVAGHVEAADAVFRRVVERWSREVASGTPVGCYGLIGAGQRPSRRLIEIEERVPTHSGERLRTA